MSEIAKGYKKTEVGVIPEDWEVRELGDIGETIIGLTYKPENIKERGILVLRSSNVGESGLKYNDNVYVNVAVKERLIVIKNDILVCVRNGSRNLIGKCALIDEKIAGQTFGAFMSVFRSKYNNYVYYQFKSFLIKKQIDENMGATINQITNKNLNSFKIPLPSLPEQTAIAEALSDTDSLISSLEKLIDKKRKIKEGAMQELLTGKKRLEGFSGEWEVKRLGEIAEIKTGKKNNEDKIIDGKYPFFVRSQTMERINSYSYDGEAILVPGEGGIGNIFHYINGKFDYHQRVYKISDFKNDVYGKFIFFCMVQKFGVHALKNTVKATVDSLRLPTFNDFEFLCPSTKEEQTAIAEILSDMDSEISLLETKLEKYKQIKQGMMQELLMGRIRLV